MCGQCHAGHQSLLSSWLSNRGSGLSGSKRRSPEGDPASGRDAASSQEQTPPKVAATDAAPATAGADISYRPQRNNPPGRTPNGSAQHSKTPTTPQTSGHLMASTGTAAVVPHAAAQSSHERNTVDLAGIGPVLAVAQDMRSRASGLTGAQASNLDPTGWVTAQAVTAESAQADAFEGAQADAAEAAAAADSISRQRPSPRQAGKLADIPSPICPKHHKPCLLKRVGKAGPNQGM